MKYVLAILFLLFHLLPYAQQTTIVDQITIGATNSDDPTSIILNGDGSMLLLGTSNSGISGDKTTSPYGLSDLWLIKLNSDYSIAWQMAYGGSGNEQRGRIIKLIDGNCMILCDSDSPISGNKTIAGAGMLDYWVIKIDPNGAILWQDTFGGTDNESGTHSICELPDESVLLAGSSRSDISGEKSENSKGLSDFWIVKIDAAGGIIWDKTIGGAGWESLFDMVVDDNSNVLLSGNSDSDISGDKYENSYGAEDYWIVKLNQFGTIIWEKTIGGDDYDAECKIISLGVNTLVCGTSASNISGIKTEDNLGIVDYWVLKIDNMGNIIWQKTIGGDMADGEPKIVFTNDYQLIIAGNSASNVSGFKSEPNWGDSDFWLVSLDTNGLFLWDKTLGATLYDSACQIVEKSDNNYVVVGSSDSNISGDKDEVSEGGRDYWIVEISSTVGQIENEIYPIIIYPNPSSDFIVFNDAVSNVKIINGQGQLVLNSIYMESNKLDVSNLSTGIYFVQYLFNEKMHSQKLVVQ